MQVCNLRPVSRKEFYIDPACQRQYALAPRWNPIDQLLQKLVVDLAMYQENSPGGLPHIARQNISQPVACQRGAPGGDYGD